MPRIVTARDAVTQTTVPPATLGDIFNSVKEDVSRWPYNLCDVSAEIRKGVEGNQRTMVTTLASLIKETQRYNSKIVRNVEHDTVLERATTEKPIAATTQEASQDTIEVSRPSTPLLGGATFGDDDAENEDIKQQVRKGEDYVHAIDDRSDFVHEAPQIGRSLPKRSSRAKTRKREDHILNLDSFVCPQSTSSQAKTRKREDHTLNSDSFVCPLLLLSPAQ